MENWTKLYSFEEIQKKIAIYTQKLNEQKKGEELVLVVVLKGAVCFAVDLMRNLQDPVSMQFIKVSSYEGLSQKDLKVESLGNLNIENKHVLIVEDICDTGKTLSFIYASLKRQKPKTLRTICLLNNLKNRQTDFTPDDVLFELNGEFVVGYGLDLYEHYRGLKDLFVIKK
ncbi:MAG TPA: phosphoribosyltransferase family protein [Chlamydiales bacterium]|nr:phosphoribosyltransferase family protein [Chlamydiales bacterium]